MWFTQSDEIRAKIWSSYTDPGDWGVIWAELPRPLSIHARGWQVETARHCQHAHWVSHKNAWCLSAESQCTERVHWPSPTLYCSLAQIWSRQVLGDVCHRSSPDPRWWHRHLGSCSHSVPIPSCSLIHMWPPMPLLSFYFSCFYFCLIPRGCLCV